MQLGRVGHTRRTSSRPRPSLRGGSRAELFRRAVPASQPRPPSPRRRPERLEALPERGTVLDVGVGGGAISLPLASRPPRSSGWIQAGHAGRLPRERRGGRHGAQTLHGPWPDVANEAGPADLVIAGHVLYNVSEPAPFVRALDAHARRRVVLELTQRHPLTWMSDLWMRFHGLDRPSGPTADDAVAVLADIGIQAEREDRPVSAAENGAGSLAARMRSTWYASVCAFPLSETRRSRSSWARLGCGRSAASGTCGPTARTVVTIWWDTTVDGS